MKLERLVVSQSVACGGLMPTTCLSSTQYAMEVRQGHIHIKHLVKGDEIVVFFNNVVYAVPSKDVPAKDSKPVK
jgi:hypothetical protein